MKLKLQLKFRGDPIGTLRVHPYLPSPGILIPPGRWNYTDAGACQFFVPDDIAIAGSYVRITAGTSTIQATIYNGVMEGEECGEEGRKTSHLYRSLGMKMRGMLLPSRKGGKPFFFRGT
jgi:hypothetical protein